jgi:hypothetical protein
MKNFMKIEWDCNSLGNDTRPIKSMTDCRELISNEKIKKRKIV